MNAVLCHRLGLIAVLGLFVADAAQASTSSAPVAPRLVVQTGQSNTRTAAWSPDGRLVASGGTDGRVVVWDAGTGRQLHALHGGAGAITRLQFSGDGTTLLAGSASGEVQGWDVVSGVRGAAFQVGAEVRGLWASERSDTLMVAKQTGVVLVIETSPQKLTTIDIAPFGLTTAAISPDRSTVAIAKMPSKAILLYDARTGAHLRDLVGHDAQVNALAFSPDGRTLASGSDDGSVRLCDWRSGEVRRVIAGHGRQVESLEFNRDGTRLLSAGVTVHVWDVATGADVATGVRPRDYVTGAAFSPRGDRVLAIDATGMAVWDVARGEPLVEMRGRGRRARSIGFSPDGQRLVVGGDVWDLRTGQSSATSISTGEFQAVDWRHDGAALLADGPRGPTLWDTATWRDLRVFEAPGTVSSMALSPDGRLVAAGVFQPEGAAEVRLWDARTGAPKGIWPVNDHVVRRVVFSPDGKWLAAGGHDRPVTLWNVAAGRQTAVMEGEPHDAFVFTPDSRALALADAQGRVRLQPVTGGDARAFAEHGAGVSAMRYSPDGTRLATAGSDGSLRLWNAADGAALQTLRGHDDRIADLDFSPDGRWLATTSDDATTRLWAVGETGWRAMLLQLQGAGTGPWISSSGVVVDAAGRFDAADLEGLQGLHWVLPSAPLVPVPLEAFMRDFYEPRLLPRLLGGDPLPPVAAVAAVDTRVPDVRIVGFAAGGAPDTVDVEVEVATANGVPLRAQDLRLMRDGQLVGWVDGALPAGTTPGTFRRHFPVRLPTAGASSSFVFSAYAFNGDRIKTPTAFDRYIVPTDAPFRAPGPRRAILVNIGVDVYESPAWDLAFAASDARLIGGALETRLRATGQFDDVVRIELVSDADTPDAATKAAIEDALRGLSRGEAGRAPVGPDDVVIVSFSGHGAVSRDGGFHLLPHDIGETGSRLVTPELLAHGIGTDELGAWLRDIDAGELVLILDACHSAASIAQPGFKPGPMGSRGLGQLAYDKGLRILAATQPNDVALESDATQHGLLSYALVKDGIEQGKADYAPVDGRIALPEWLHYALDRVPALAAEVRSGAVASRGAAPVVRNGAALAGPPDTRALQRPSLFDFRRRATDVDVVAH
ncbi:WD40 domain-containing protein [Lysobacter xanthus]